MNPLLSDSAAHNLPEHATRAWWDRAYRDGPVRWDTGRTPPEVQAFWRSGLSEPVGLALDLGCGSGTNTRYLASLGLSVIGVELSNVALTRAYVRLGHGRSDGETAAWLIQGDASALPINNLEVRYILDVGCFHSLPRTRRTAYAAGIVDNLAPGGFFHLYAHDASEGALANPNVRGVGETEVVQLFTPKLALASIQRGRPDPTPSRWYLLYKPLDRMPT